MHYFVSIIVLQSSFKNKGKLVAFLLLSYICIATIDVMWFFLTVPWVGLQYVIFLDHTHLLVKNISMNSLNCF